MDDPWGSPWAEPTSKSTLAPTETAKSLLSPPPRAFFGATSPSSSPWADDADGFGDWAGPSSDQHEQASASPNWGAWGEPSPTRSPTRPSATTHLDPSGKANPVAWPSSGLPSPLLSPLPRSRASSTTRQSVGDPWAAELSRNLAKTDILTANDSRDEKGSAPTNIVDPIPRIDSFEDIEKSSELPIGCSTAKVGATQNSASGLSPRSSFANSVDSHRDFDRQDSPITPMDDEPRVRLHANAQQGPGKVQELVGMYDDLNRGASDEPEQATSITKNRALGGSITTERPSRSVSVSSPEPDLDVSGEESSRESKLHRKGSSASSVRSATPKAAVAPTAEQATTSSKIEDHEHLPRYCHTELVQDILTKFGPLDFQPNVKAFETLFKDSPDHYASNITGPDSDDGVVKDSFSEISERKAWYRISRFGSMRKHDLGNDDNNYTSVSWPVTRLHDETIVIVRRWMEEDSFVGKSMLGGNKRSSVFNWDSSAAPVDLSTIYGRKASFDMARSPTTATATRHTSQSSVSSQTSAWGKRHSQQSSRTDSPILATPTPAAAPSFGWSSSGPAKPTVSFALPPAAPKPATPQPAKDTLSEPDLPTSTQKVPVSKALLPVQPLSLDKARPSASQDLEDEDDDWGDMVASPGIEHGTPAQASGPFTTPTLTSTQTKALTRPSSSLADAWSNDDFSSSEVATKATNRAADHVPIADEKPNPTEEASQKAHTIATASTTCTSEASISLADSPPRTKSALKPTDSAKSSTSTSTTTPAQISDEDLSIANTIINNLPDLSYMLR